MFVKIVTIALIAFIGTSKGEREWDGFVASWDLDTSQHFYNLPRSFAEALSSGWSYVSGVEEPKGTISLGYYGDPRFVLLFWRGGPIGFQIGFPVADVQDLDQPLKYAELDAVITKTLNGVEYYTGTAFYLNNEARGVRKLWLQEKTGLLEIPTNASLIATETPQFQFTACIPTMGNHYYTWTNTSDCATLYPWFVLALGEDVIGVGFQGVGGNVTSAASRTWFETIPDGALDIAVPDAPVCAQEAIAEFGALSIHVWFVEGPQNITCS